MFALAFRWRGRRYRRQVQLALTPTAEQKLLAELESRKTRLSDIHSAAQSQTAGENSVSTPFKASVPQWGFASSPLVVQGIVTVFAGAPHGKTLVAYKEENGEPVWTAGVGPESEKAALSYCSPQLATIHGVDQILLATDVGLSAFDPSAGKELWHYSWPADNGARIVQPALVDDGDVLIGSWVGTGTRRISVRRDGEAWSTEEKWTNRKFRPYFNDLVLATNIFTGSSRASSCALA